MPTADDDQPRTPPPRSRLTRRGFLRAAGLGGAAAILLQQDGHDASPPPVPFPSIPIVPPKTEILDHKQRYDAAYQRLVASVAPAAQELSDFAGQFSIFDTLVLLKGFDVTLVPPHGHLEGACQYRMRDGKDKRSGTLPAVNRLLRACVEIQLLNEECPVRVHERLDCNAVASQVTAEFQRLNPRMQINPHVLQQECADVFRRLTSECAPFLRPGSSNADFPRDLTESRVLELQLNGRVPLNVTILNPTLKKNQDEAFALRSAGPGR
jgi:hypothetical protein